MFHKAPENGCRNLSLALCILSVLLFVLGLGWARAYAAEIKFIPMLAFREEYNDNLFFDSTDADKTRDWITTISPGARFTDRTERIDALLQARFDIIKYGRSDDLNATDQFQLGRFDYLLTERLRTSAQAVRTRDSRPDRDIETTGLVLGTARRDRMNYAVSSDYALSEKAAATFTYAYDDVRFDSSDFVDSTSQNAAIRLAYNLSSVISTASARLNVGYGLYDFPDAQIVNYTAAIGASKQFSEAFTLSADIGRNRTRSSFETMFWFFTIEERSIQRGTIGDLTLAYTGDRTGGSISLIQEVRALSGRSGTTRQTSVQFDVSRRFTYELTGSFLAKWYLNKAGKDELSGTEIDEQTFWIQPALIYNITNDLALRASYRLIRLKDYVSDQKSGQSIGFLSVAWQYPMPRS